MATQSELAQTFKGLHIPGNPVIIYNVWDAGSAQAVASVGAKAIATGGHGVANAHGFEDGEKIPLELVLENAARITNSIDLPFSMDIDTGYGKTESAIAETVRGVLGAGVIGINIEDKLVGTTTLRSMEEQSSRIKAIRLVADEIGVPLFINARSDVFSTTKPSQHSEATVIEAVKRAEAYKAAGADGFFVPLLSDIDLINRLCDQSPLPVNILWLDSSPEAAELAKAGVARISYGPGPYLKMIEWLKDNARSAVNYK